MERKDQITDSPMQALGHLGAGCRASRKERESGKGHRRLGIRKKTVTCLKANFPGLKQGELFSGPGTISASTTSLPGYLQGPTEGTGPSGLCLQTPCPFLKESFTAANMAGGEAPRRTGTRKEEKAHPDPGASWLRLSLFIHHW